MLWVLVTTTWRKLPVPGALFTPGHTKNQVKITLIINNHWHFILNLGNNWIAIAKMEIFSTNQSMDPGGP